MKSIEPLIGGLIRYEISKNTSLYYLLLNPLIGGLKCSFAFLERGAVEELFTGLECGE